MNEELSQLYYDKDQLKREKTETEILIDFYKWKIDWRVNLNIQDNVDKIIENKEKRVEELKKEIKEISIKILNFNID